MRILLTTIFIAFTLVACRVEHREDMATTSAPTSVVNAADGDTALIEATRAYVKQESGITESNVRIVRKSGDYARLYVEPISGETDPPTVFMRFQNGKWTAVTHGTGFAPDTLRALGIPQPLWSE